MLITSTDKTTRIWDATNGQEIGRINNSLASESLVNLPGKMFASTVGSSILIWNATTRELIKTLENGHTDSVTR